MNSGVKIVSPFQLLWLAASGTMTIAALHDLRDDLETMNNTSLVPSDRAIFTSAISELDGLLVSRLAVGLASGADARL
jgi:hypothetical protein